MLKNSIEVVNLSKIYHLKGKAKTITALDNINLSIKEGEIFGLLGPNGAGKTTMLQILSTLMHPTEGYVKIDGLNILKSPKQAKSKISLMLENSMLYNRITGYDNLKFFCKIYKVPNFKEKIHEHIKFFGLEKWLNQYVENFSSGMKMKLALCRTLLLDREILLLDEPTLGLDLESKNLIIDKLKKINKTIFLTSHDMKMVEKLCNRIAFLDKGKILKIGTKEELRRLLQQEIKIEIEIMKNKDKLKSELSDQDFINEINDTTSGIKLTLKNRESYKDLASILSNYEFLKINELEDSLEELFLKIINSSNVH